MRMTCVECGAEFETEIGANRRPRFKTCGPDCRRASRNRGIRRFMQANVEMPAGLVQATRDLMEQMKRGPQ